MSKNRFLKKASAIVLSIALLGSIAMTVSAAGAYDNHPQSIISQAKAVEAESEAIVLLKNGEVSPGTKSLPLAAGVKVNVFGKAADNPYYDGGGSGATNASSRRVTFYNALTAAGIEFNTELRSYYASQSPSSNEGVSTARNEVPFATLEASTAYQNATTFSDTAIVFLGRQGSEFSDNGPTALYLKASEDALIKAVGASHSNLIIIFDTCQAMDSDFVKDPAYGVDSALYSWAPGDFGFTAVADTLLGRYNPSGHLADTIVDDPQANPSYINFGNFQYTGTFPISNNPTGTNWNTTGAANQNKFLEYEEGIYMGYRYWETFAPERVVYPFGYGLSYTDFSWSNYRQTRDSDIVTVKVDVKNTGAVAGKDVVQIYVEQPYTVGGIEKAKRVLAGYAKTSLLAPNASETVTVAFNLYDIASWDIQNGRYVTEKGEYKVFASENASEAGKLLNGSFTLAADRVFATDPTTGTALKNLFPDARGEGTVLSRADHDGTFPTAPGSKAMADEFRTTIDKFPTPAEGTAFPFSASAGTDPIQLQAIYDKAEEDVEAGTYDNMDDALWNSPMWNDFLSQLTLAEAVDLCRQGGYQTIGLTRLGIPRTIDNDGPQQAKSRNNSGIGGSGTAYPINTAMACTWNDKLNEEVGVCYGQDSVLVGLSVTYSPSLNLHRTPYSGRNFEYFSEDPMISGRMAAAQTRGIQSQHVVVTLKHYAVNDCETNRSGVNTWADEQTLRELYFKAFEIGVKEGGAHGMMTAFNRIGHVWAGASKALCTDLLRTEWGFRGFIVTDYYSGGYMLPPLMILAQNDISLGNANATSMINYNNQLDPVGMSNALAASVKNLSFMKMRTWQFASDEPIPVPVPVEPTETLNGVYKAKLTNDGKVDTIIVELDRNLPNAEIFGEDLFEVPGYEITYAYMGDENGVEMPMETKYLCLALTPQAPAQVINVNLKKSFSAYNAINFTNGGFILDNLSASVNVGDVVTVPITAKFADKLSAVKGTIKYDESLLTLQSFTPKAGFTMQSSGTTFIVAANSGMGVSGDTVIGYAVFIAKSGLEDDVKTLVSFPFEKLSGVNEAGKGVYVIIPKTEVTIVAEPPMRGDVSLDGQVDLSDLVLLMQYLSGNTTLNNRQLKAADVSNDGAVNVGDSIIIMQMCLN